MSLITCDAPNGFLDPSIQAMEDNAIVTGDGTGDHGWCHGEDGTE